MSLRENDQVLVMFTSLIVENDVADSDIFRDVFPEYICDLPPECEVEFSII